MKLVELIQDMLSEFVWSILVNAQGRVSDAREDHRRIYEAIRRRDAAGAQRHMEAHILSLAKSMNGQGPP